MTCFAEHATYWIYVPQPFLRIVDYDAALITARLSLATLHVISLAVNMRRGIQFYISLASSIELDLAEVDARPDCIQSEKFQILGWRCARFVLL